MFGEGWDPQDHYELYHMTNEELLHYSWLQNQAKSAEMEYNFELTEEKRAMEEVYKIRAVLMKTQQSTSDAHMRVYLYEKEMKEKYKEYYPLMWHEPPVNIDPDAMQF